MQTDPVTLAVSGSFQQVNGEYQVTWCVPALGTPRSPCPPLYQSLRVKVKQRVPQSREGAQMTAKEWQTL
jgi:hypothetical protein